jgi:predicted metal-dependent hydrolase
MEEVKVLHITSQLSIDVIRKDIKNMHLAVYPPTGRVRIAAPLQVNDEAVRLFAISKIAVGLENTREIFLLKTVNQLDNLKSEKVIIFKVNAIY